MTCISTARDCVCVCVCVYVCGTPESPGSHHCAAPAAHFPSLFATSQCCNNSARLFRLVRATCCRRKEASYLLGRADVLSRIVLAGLLAGSGYRPLALAELLRRRSLVRHCRYVGCRRSWFGRSRVPTNFERNGACAPRPAARQNCFAAARE